MEVKALIPYDWTYLLSGSADSGYYAQFVGCAVSNIFSWPDDENPVRHSFTATPEWRALLKRTGAVV